MTTRVVSLAQARRIALDAQGLTRPRPAPGGATMRHLRRVIDTVGVVQIDSVNVLVRSHYLPFFSRLGPYDRSMLDRARDRAPRHLIEYWAHEAALVAPATWPLLAHRMAAAETEAWGGIKRVREEHPGLVEAVLEVVERAGPITAREAEAHLSHDRGAVDAEPEWGWNWSAVKRALEWLFWSGTVTSAGRTTSFERRYAALAAVLPHDVLAARSRWWDVADPSHEAAAIVELTRLAARAHGVGTLVCFADYFRLPPRRVLPAIETLVAAGELEPVTVSGWRRTAYLHHGAARSRSVHVEALVSPFDSVVWQRARTESLFGVRFRLEIYTPAAKRVHGYYVLPFFFGDTIVARVDLKADRASGRLLVRQVTWEEHSPDAARAALDGELLAMAEWLGLAEVIPGPDTR